LNMSFSVHFVDSPSLLHLVTGCPLCDIQDAALPLLRY